MCRIPFDHRAPTAQRVELDRWARLAGEWVSNRQSTATRATHNAAEDRLAMAPDHAGVVSAIRNLQQKRKRHKALFVEGPCRPGTVRSTETRRQKLPADLQAQPEHRLSCLESFKSEPTHCQLKQPMFALSSVSKFIV